MTTHGPLPRPAAEMVKGHIHRKRWYRLVSALACVVVFCVTYALIMPAVTLTHETYCGLEEHTHSDDCYTRPLLCQTEENHAHTGLCYETAEVCVCPLPETEGHGHSDECYTERECYVCGLEETEGHTHDPSCYQTVETLVCSLEETDGHTHGESCYESRSELSCAEDHEHSDECYTITQTLSCPRTETPPHHHDPACFETTQQLSCPLEETAAHHHDGSCLGTELVLSCGLDECDPHAHTEECFETQLVLSCQTEEGHTHTDECYGEPELSCELDEHTHTAECCCDPSSSLETAADWERTLAGVTLTGEWPTDVVAVAKSQLGYTESVTNFIVTDSGLRKGYTRYGAWYGVPYGDWCAMYVSFCLSYAGVPASAVPRNSGCRPWIEALDALGLYYPAAGPYEAQSGDIVFFDLDSCGLADHVGLVVSAENGLVTTIEGNSGNCVAYNTYALDDARLYGYASLALAYLRHTGQDVAPLAEEIEYFCGLEEHAHADECYDENGELICPLPEHEHTEECLVEPQGEPYEDLLAAVQALEALDALSGDDRLAAEELLERLEESHRLGSLTDGEYADLYARVLALLYEANDTVAEAAEGTNWILLRDSGWFEEYADAGTAETGVAALSLNAAPMLLAAAEGDTSPSARQIDRPGGENSADGVTVSKTIAGTDLENVFDITLTVETPQKLDEVISEPDMAVVIVMDISNTMNNNFGGVTRYAAAMEAAEDFLDSFAESNSLGNSKIGYVAFNTDAHEIFPLQSCTNEAQAKALKNTMRTLTGNIINNYEKKDDGTVTDPSRFTNMEAGLKMARDMLAGVSNKNKFVIFLSDGFPTTYVKSGYSGYNPIYSNISSDTHNYIRDDIFPNKPFTYGTNYSDRGAVKAREMATAMKNSGITIFSIGVNVEGQSLQAYITQSANNNYSTMDRTSESYEIGGVTTGYFTAWLKDSIGSGYYYDSTNTDGLKDAYDQIFAKIKKTIETATAADWVASDPIPNVQPGEIEFIGLYDKAGILQGDTLTGTHEAGAENTASYGKDADTDDDTITWDLKSSGYTTSASGDTTTYSYELRYRVRLTNENSQFVEKKVYETNGTTSLQYRTVQTVNGTTTISGTKTIDFPVPSVYGYLADLEFEKVDNRGSPLSGAEFTLRHAENCDECRGNGTQVSIGDKTVTSDEDGKVKFTNIPSGHTYTLTETKVPDGYSTDGYQYTVKVAYDIISVTIKDSGQNVVGTWDNVDNPKIVNNTAYKLPNTGGGGTRLFAIAGAALMTAAALGFALRRRKRPHE